MFDIIKAIVETAGLGGPTILALVTLGGAFYLIREQSQSKEEQLNSSIEAAKATSEALSEISTYAKQSHEEVKEVRKKQEDMHISLTRLESKMEG